MFPPSPVIFYFYCRALTLHDTAGPFNIASGAILGIGAGFLWTAQGSLMLAYPTEDNKGKFIAIFWSIFNLGGVVGAAASLGQNYESSVSAEEDHPMRKERGCFTDRWFLGKFGCVNACPGGPCYRAGVGLFVYHFVSMAGRSLFV